MLATTLFCLRGLLHSREEQVVINLTFNGYTASAKVTGIQNDTAVVSIDDFFNHITCKLALCKCFVCLEQGF